MGAGAGSHPLWGWCLGEPSTVRRKSGTRFWSEENCRRQTLANPACPSPWAALTSHAQAGWGFDAQGTGFPQSPTQPQHHRVAAACPSCAHARSSTSWQRGKASRARPRAPLWPQLQAAWAQAVLWVRRVMPTMPLRSAATTGCLLGTEGCAWVGLG